jgi:hypothetical protein
MKPKPSDNKISVADGLDDDAMRAAEGYAFYSAEAEEFAEATRTMVAEAWVDEFGPWEQPPQT